MLPIRLVLLIPGALAAAHSVHGQTVLVSTNSQGTSPDSQSNMGNRGVGVGPSGQFVAFDSSASNLVGNDVNGWKDCFVKDLSTGEVHLASLGDLDQQPPRISLFAQVSASDLRVLLERRGRNRPR